MSESAPRISGAAIEVLAERKHKARFSAQRVDATDWIHVAPETQDSYRDEAREDLTAILPLLCGDLEEELKQVRSDLERETRLGILSDEAAQEAERDAAEWKARHRRQKKLRKRARGQARHWKHNHGQQVRRVQQIAGDLERVSGERNEQNRTVDLLTQQLNQVREEVEKRARICDKSCDAGTAKNPPCRRAEAQALRAVLSYMDGLDSSSSLSGDGESGATEALAKRFWELRAFGEELPSWDELHEEQRQSKRASARAFMRSTFQDARQEKGNPMPEVNCEETVTITLRRGVAAAAVQALGYANNISDEAQQAKREIKDALDTANSGDVEERGEEEGQSCARAGVITESDRERLGIIATALEASSGELPADLDNDGALAPILRRLCSTQQSSTTSNSLSREPGKCSCDYDGVHLCHSLPPERCQKGGPPREPGDRERQTEYRVVGTGSNGKERVLATPTTDDEAAEKAADFLAGGDPPTYTGVRVQTSTVTTTHTPWQDECGCDPDGTLARDCQRTGCRSATQPNPEPHLSGDGERLEEGTMAAAIEALANSLGGVCVPRPEFTGYEQSKRRLGLAVIAVINAVIGRRDLASRLSSEDSSGPPREVVPGNSGEAEGEVLANLLGTIFAVRSVGAKVQQPERGSRRKPLAKPQPDGGLSYAEAKTHQRYLSECLEIANERIKELEAGATASTQPASEDSSGEDSYLCLNCGSVSAASGWSRWQRRDDGEPGDGEYRPSRDDETDPLIKCPRCGELHGDCYIGAGIDDGTRAECERERAKLLEIFPEYEKWWADVLTSTQPASTTRLSEGTK